MYKFPHKALQIFVLFCAFAIIVPTLDATFSSSYAQSAGQKKKSKSILQILFGRKKQNKAQTKNKVVRKKPTSTKAATPEVEKSENAQTILVMGDFMANGFSLWGNYTFNYNRIFLDGGINELPDFLNSLSDNFTEKRKYFIQTGYYRFFKKPNIPALGV